MADVLIVHTTEPWKLERTRTALRDFVAHKLKRGDSYKEAGLVAFVAPDARSWRFSFVRMEYETRRDPKTGKIAAEERLTPARRFSYIVGEHESCHTAQSRFLELLQDTENKPTLEQLEKAFSVEAVTKQFFEDFSGIFQEVSGDISKRNPNWPGEQVEREAQTLLSRLLFLYFVQRKGWLNRQRDYLYSKCKKFFTGEPDGVSCYNQFLKPLFVKLSDADAFFPNLDLGDVPFLNGGLFDDEMDSLNERGRMKIGNAALRDVFEKLLELYNFTVREDTPLEQEVAIDPEMLGKIFESLVLQLEQSDTGGKTSRHDTGSYYTPRPIVHYLCREGLRAWLEQFPPGNAADWPSRLETLFTLDAAEDLSEKQRAVLDTCLTPEEARALVNRLDEFRACDPAVGSGAFLVGLLHELVSLQRLCETRARGKDPAERDSDWLYTTKKRIIENVLYGVDIQQRAVEICNLRLWISLMVDYPLEVDPDNCALPDFRKAIRNVTPLPNLDFKIRRANSLIETIRGHVINFPQTATDSREFSLSLNRLAAAKHRFYEARHKKDKYLAQLDILDATADIAQYEFSAAKLKFGLLPSDKDAERVAEFAAAEAEMGKLQLQIAAARKKRDREKGNDIERLSRVFNDEEKPTFVWQLDFAEIFHRAKKVGDDVRNVNNSGGKSQGLLTSAPTTEPGGFDLVLANLPYVRQEKIKALKPALQNAYDCYTGIADLYVYFFERGVKLLGEGGMLSFVSSNKFFRAGYGEKLRRFLAERTELRAVIDFGDLPIFEATAYPCIVVTRKRRPEAECKVRTFNVKTEAELTRFTELTRNASVALAQKDFCSEGWQLEPPAVLKFFDKLRTTRKTLREFVGSRVYRGITTGLNEAFVVDRPTRDRLIREDKSSAEILKPYLCGKDVNRWLANSEDQWIIFMRRGTKLKKFPAIENYLLQFKEKLMPGKSGGRKPGSYEWFEIQDNIAYWQEFERPKIISTKISIRPTFALDEASSYLGNTSYFVSAATGGRFLLGLLNSSLFFAYAKRVFVGKQGGWFEVQPDGLELFPIAAATTEQQESVERLVDRALAAKEIDPDADVSAAEQQIDRLVYVLYGLTLEEIKIVEDATK